MKKLIQLCQCIHNYYFLYSYKNGTEIVFQKKILWWDVISPPQIISSLPPNLQTPTPKPSKSFCFWIL